MVNYKLIAVIMTSDKIEAFRLSSGIYNVDMTPNEVREQLIKRAIKINKIQLSDENELLYNLDGIQKIKNTSINNNDENGSLFIAGDRLNSIINKETQGKEKRVQYKSIIDYIDGKYPNHIVYALYGLRRTGKTTLLLQACKYCTDKGYKVAYCDIPRNNKIDCSQLNSAIFELIDLNYKVIIIDEITYIEDFIGWSNILSDIIAKIGVKVIIAGTQSFAIYLSSKHELLDRIHMESTTYISFKEFSRLLNTSSVYDYIRYGGILGYSRRTKVDSHDYIDSAIIDNIETSLKDYNRISFWPKIAEAIETNTLHTYVYTLINSITKSAVIRSLKDTFRDHNLRSAISFMPEIKPFLNIKYLEGIREKQCSLVDIPIDKIDDGIIQELIMVFNILEITIESSVLQNNIEYTDFIYNQPGLRYAQIVDLLDVIFRKSIYESGVNTELSAKIKQKIIEDIEGKLLEDVVVAYIMQKYANIYEVFKLRLAKESKEIDIVIRNKDTNNLAIFEVKRSDKIVANQYRWLIDSEITEYLTSRFGDIKNRYVLYSGSDNEVTVGEYKIIYKNISKFLLESNRE